MSINIGWWAIPTIITLGSLIWVCWPQRQQGLGGDVVGAIFLLIAIIVSLLSWLFWALAA